MSKRIEYMGKFIQAYMKFTCHAVSGIELNRLLFIFAVFTLKPESRLRRVFRLWRVSRPTVKSGRDGFLTENSFKLLVVLRRYTRRESCSNGREARWNPSRIHICRFHTKDGIPSKTSFPSVTSFPSFCEIGMGRVFDRKLDQHYSSLYSSI